MDYYLVGFLSPINYLALQLLLQLPGLQKFSIGCVSLCVWVCVAQPIRHHLSNFPNSPYGSVKFAKATQGLISARCLMIRQISPWGTTTKSK
jgi:hypothetical protein